MGVLVLEIDNTDLKQKGQESKTIIQGIEDSFVDMEKSAQKAADVAGRAGKEIGDGFDKGNKEGQKQVGIIQQLEKHLKRLQIGQRKAFDEEEIKKYNVEIAKTEKELKRLRTAGVSGLNSVTTATKGSRAAFAGLGATIGAAFAPVLVAGAAIAGVKQVVSLVSEYEQTAADLSAITGAQGETLEFLKQSAVEVGVTTTVSANDTLKAYQLIASARPELLKNAEALAAVTKEAVVLNEAYGGDLPTTATNLIDIMNKTGQPIEAVARVTNSLAAGSKEGSAAISELAASYLVAGTEVRASGASLEEGVAVFEALATQGLSGAEAGTKLRNVLIKLAATDVLPKDAQKRLEAAGVDMDALSDKTLTLSDRLRALEPIQNDANALTAVFGAENKGAAADLIGLTDQIDTLKDKVTDTNVAYEQAETRTTTLRQEWTRLKNTIQALIQGDGAGLEEFLRVLVKVAREGLLFFKARIDDMRPTLEVLGATFAEFGRALRSIIPDFDGVVDKASILQRVIKVLNVPFQILFKTLNFGVQVLTKTIRRYEALIGNTTKLSGFLEDLGNNVEFALDVFIALPDILVGAFNAIETWVNGVATGLARFAVNANRTFREAFNIKKILTEGTDDLLAAGEQLLVNPFTGIGSAAKEAFIKGYNESKESFQVDPVDLELDINAQSDNTDIVPTEFTDPELAAKKQRDIAKARIDAMREGVEKQLALEELRYSDLKERLEEFNLETEEATFQHELNKFNIRQRFLQDAADLEGLSGEERIAFLYEQTKAEIDAIESALREAGGGDITDEQQRQINKMREDANASYLEQLGAFQNQELAAEQQHEINLLELQRGSFDSQKDFEEFKQQEILKIRLAYAEEQLKIIEALEGAESDAALSMRKTINEIKGSLEEIQNSGGASSQFSLFSLFGLDPNDPKSQDIVNGIQTAANQAVSIVNQVNADRIAAAQANIDRANAEIAALDDKIAAQENVLDRELELAEKGENNRADSAQAELNRLIEQREQEKEQAEKALEQKKKIQKQQEIINTATQASSLFSAAAQIYESLAKIPFAGVPLATGLIATMVASFAAAKVKVFQAISQQKAEKGLSGTIRGRRHSGGGEPFVDGIEAEDGEDYGILSRFASGKYGRAFRALTDALNKGNRKDKIKALNALYGSVRTNPSLPDELTRAEAQLSALQHEITDSRNAEATNETNRLLRMQLEQARKSEESLTYTDDSKISRIGNNVRITKLNK